MVFTTLAKLSSAAPGKLPDYEGRYNMKTYGFAWKHVKHHFCLAPLHVCTILGGTVATIYIIRMLYVRDCIMFSWRKHKPIKQNENITLFDAAVDFSKRPASSVYPDYEK